MIKNKKALDNVRNTQIGHIQVDYRICCAMANFTMIPCIPDGKLTIQIAKRIKKRCLKKQNKLSRLLMMNLPDFKAQRISDIKSIEDFPRLTLSQFRRRITLGNFKIRQSRSYIDQFIKNGTIFVVNENQLLKHNIHPKIQNEFQESKIIAIFILSRHKRGKKTNKTDSNDVDPRNFTFYYKVFIQYIPTNKIQTDSSQYKYIKSKYYHFAFGKAFL